MSRSPAQPDFIKFCLTPAGWLQPAIAIAACRAGAVGVLNAELHDNAVDWHGPLQALADAAGAPYGLKLSALGDGDEEVLVGHVARGLRWLMLDVAKLPASSDTVGRLRAQGLRVIVEVLAYDEAYVSLLCEVDGILLKGNEAGGYVGEDSSFILLQKWLAQRSRGVTAALPLFVRGGLTPPVAAACSAVGVAGGIFDSQLLLLDEARLPAATQALLAGLSGNETVAVGDGERGEYFRVLNRPGHAVAKALVADGDGQGFEGLRGLVHGKVGWADPRNALLPLGHDVCFAAPWRERYGRVAALCQAVDAAVAAQLAVAASQPAVIEDAPLARTLGVRLPIVQGPMTRVSDVAAFAEAVAAGGALPMVAFALLKGQALETLLQQTAERLAGRPWGIGLLGFAPQALLDEQLATAARYKPSCAIIAGGRPDQAVKLEAAGVPTFLHVPSANLVPLFLQEGARRFIFEGRECGGHIGPLSSFVLWSTMVDRLLEQLDQRAAPAEELQLLFAGGIHDAVSSAMVQVLVAPLTARGVRCGILMGSAYLFTSEIVATGAVVERFQQQVMACRQTVNLESGPGHASRCAYTPFAEEFFRKREALRQQGAPGDESRRVLDDLIMGRLRIASKGSARTGPQGSLETLDEAQQLAEGMYMLGQVATLRDSLTTIERLHAEVSTEAAALLEQRRAIIQAGLLVPPAVLPRADIAIVGIASLLPKADTTQTYWENILDKVDAITEIPPHRWDWRLYYDPDRNAKDKIYSKWGGFLDDLAFDPTRYGMPPKSIESVDPMQLMALEVARRTLADAGYENRPFDRERASVIVGASGGTGDVGSQYGLRSELPRFNGSLSPDVAALLPEWTEDSFAGILLNVIAGRIANRLNFGGVNFTVDAACASSLSAIYQGVSELASGRSDLVIAGGVDTVQGPFGYLCFSKTQALSPRGRCSTFDASGDGIVISEGIAMVALKRLEDAERDGDRIYGVIKGVGGSSDGNAKGMTAPLPAGQLRAMRRAYAQAGFGPETVGLFEAHGTGTVAGDTAELESTSRLIREARQQPRAAVIGSVKTMIGHTKATAGVAGLIKAVLAMHHRVLPPHRGVDQPNRILQQADSPLYLVDEAMPWLQHPSLPRRAAVSAFGFGGTNFHVVLEEYGREYRPWMQPAASRRWPAELLIMSGESRKALANQVEHLQAVLPSLALAALRDLAASLWANRQPGAQTLAVVARDVADLGSKLSAALAFLQGSTQALPSGVQFGQGEHRDSKVAVLFPGQGSQYPGMGREVAVHFPAAAETLAAADKTLEAPLGERFGALLSQFIFPRGAYSDEAKTAAREALTSTDVAQPALGAVEAALWAVMQSLGLQPSMFAGHSYGEFVAHHAAGAIGFDDLMRLSAGRGRFIVDAARASGAELGTMAAVQASRKQVEDVIADIADVIIANHNAPQQSILSGTRAGVRLAVDKLVQAGIDVTEIPVAAAFHSALVRPAQEPLAEMIEATPWQPAAVPVYSNTTARAHGGDVRRTKKQMAEHLVRPVEFVSEVEALYDDGARVFVEVGPKSVLTRLTGKILGPRAHLAVPTDDGSGGMAGLLNAIGRLVCAGLPLDVATLFDGRDCRVVATAKLATLAPTKDLPRHAWLLNGSGARRASEPVRQIGLTLEQVGARRDAAAAGTPSATSTHSAITPSEAAAPAASHRLSAGGNGLTADKAHHAAPVPAAVSQQTWKKDRPMDDRRGLPPDSPVMSEYFETMRRFLETQERVMSAYLSGEVPVVRPVQRQRSMAVLPRMAEFAGPAAVVAAPAAPIPVASARVVSAPVAVPATAPAPVPVVVAAAAPVPAPTPVPEKASRADTASALSRDKMVDILLGIVEEKTGYPRDMVGLDQNLESDLGIDSIKRIEVVGAMLQALPEAQRQALSESRSKLNTQPSLNGMLDLLSQAKAGGAVTVPFELAETGSKAVASHPSRHVMQAVAEPLTDRAARRLLIGHYLVLADRGGFSDELVKALSVQGCSASLVPDEVLCNEERLVAWCRSQLEKDAAPIAGVVHLAPLDAEWLPPDAPVQVWREALQRSEKSLFTVLREFSGALATQAHVLAASGLGGCFGRDRSSVQGLSLQGGAVGLLKSLREERPALRVKAVDLDPAQPQVNRLACLLTELELDGGRQEVGYPMGQRTVFKTVAAAPKRDDAQEPGSAWPTPLVVLATGGARGITAEVLRDLAGPGLVLVLTGRSALAAEEPALAMLQDAASLRQHFITQVRSGLIKMTPAELGRKIDAVLALREMRANVADLQSRGATVEYHAIDVTNDGAIAALVADVTRRHGAIGGVVHGAGVIEDKLLADKSGTSWSRVVETKVLGLLALQKHVDPARLRFFTVFSSVAGRYGNSGQSDYATANELMNRLCCQLQALWGPAVAVSALCWGPWGATRFGNGMVTAETEAKFADKGVSLVTAEIGRRLFMDAVRAASAGPVEIVCGAGPWETHESALATVREVDASLPVLGALLGAANVKAQPTGDQIVGITLDERHLYLQEHCIDGIPILPAAAALELMAEAAQTLWPGWKVVEVLEHKLLKGVDLKAPARRLQVLVNPPPYGSSEGFEVNAFLQSELGEGRALTHYRCVIRLAQQFPATFASPAARHADQSLSVGRAYGKLLFHGPRFQVIEAIDGLSNGGSAAQVRSSRPAQWLTGPAAEGTRWIFDPALLDAAAQMAWLWARTYRDQSALPARFGRVVRYQDVLPDRMTMSFDRAVMDDDTMIRATVSFLDDDGQVVLLIEDLESIASPALNRLGGTARTALAASA